jgi:threonylcarbamoyladenosine tRNA methylthiotransferase MtaB
MTNNKSVALHTLGCKLNFSETSTMSRLLENDGFETRPFNEVADFYVLNTCSVTDNADKECRMLVRRIQRQAPEAMIVITGCYAQLKPEEVAAIQGVDLVLGASEKFKIHHHIHNLIDGKSEKIHSCEVDEITGFNSSYSLGDRTRTFLKVQEGCDYNCSYCTIPMARGKSRSQPIEKVLKDISDIKKAGVKEIVFTGINLGDFGRDENGEKTGKNFYDLLCAVEEFDGVERYRISSCEPNLLSDKIIELVAGSKVIMPHFHIPLQSGSNKILGLMRRRYRKELYAGKVGKIKSLIPHCGIGVDVITGFPGETEDDVEELKDFLRRQRFDRVGIFTYSHEEGTAAYGLADNIPGEVKEQRARDIMDLQQEISYELNQEKVGKVFKSLIDKKEAGRYLGRTEFDSVEVDNEVVIHSDRKLPIGEFVQARITRAYDYDLEGEVVE